MKHLHHIILILLAAGWQACVEPVDLELPNPTARLVVVCNFSNDLNFQVLVSKTNNLSGEDKSYYVTNATVSIYAEGELLEKLTLSDMHGQNGEPYYISTNLKAEIGKLYEIRAEAPGFKSVTSYGMVPNPSDIKTTQLTQNTNGSGGGDDGQQSDGSFNITIEINDPQKFENYYHLNLYQQVKETVDDVNGPTEMVRNYGPLQMTSTDIKLPITYFFNNRGVLINDQSFNGQAKSFTFQSFFDVVPDSGEMGNIIIELRTVSKDYYLYYLTIMRQSEQQGNPLSEPVVDFSNIDNGSGIFAGFSVTRDTINLN